VDAAARVRVLGRRGFLFVGRRSQSRRAGPGRSSPEISGGRCAGRKKGSRGRALTRGAEEAGRERRDSGRVGRERSGADTRARVAAGRGGTRGVAG
jgi:hypothetical protein